VPQLDLPAEHLSFRLPVLWKRGVMAIREGTGQCGATGAGWICSEEPFIL
jgi:hypothetical protein